MTSLLLNARAEYRVCKQLLWPARASRQALCIAAAIVAAALAVAGIGWALTARFGMPASMARAIGFFIVAALATGWIAGAVKLALSQNRPAFAALVPGLHRRLLRVLGAQVVLCSVLVAGVFGLLFGRFGPALVLTGLAATWLLLMKRYPLLLVVSAGFGIGLFFRGLQVDFALAPDWFDVLDANGGTTPALVFVLALVVDLLLLKLALHKLLPKTKSAQNHGSAFSELAYDLGARRRSLQDSQSRRAATGLAGTAWRWPWRTAGSHGGAMLRAFGRAIQTGGDVRATTLTTLAIIVISMLVLKDLHHQLFISLTLSVLGMLLYAPRMYVGQVLVDIAATGAEQDLYRLTPLAPPTSGFQRRLHAALLQRFALLWLAFSVGALCLVVVTGTDTGGVMDGMLLLAALALPGARHLLRDYTKLRAGRADSPMLRAAATGGWTGVSMFVLNMARDAPDLPWRWCAAVIAILSVVAIYWRWRALLQAQARRLAR